MRYLSSVLLILLIQACDNPPQKPGKLIGKKLVKQENLPQFEIGFNGKIGKKSVSMSLNHEAGKCSGFYYYDDIMNVLKLEGFMDGDGTIQLNEIDENGRQTGVFSGKLMKKSQLIGDWTSPRGKSLSFNLLAADRLPIKIKTSRKKYVRVFEFTPEYIEQNGIDPTLIPAEGMTHEVNYLSIVTGVPTVDKRIKQAIDAVVLSLPEQKFTSVPEMLEAFQEPVERSVNTRLVRLSRNILSLVVEGNEYYFMAAHPMYYSIGINFDLNTGLQLSLMDLIRPINQDKFSQFLEQKFLKTNGDQAWSYQENNEPFPMPQHFNLTPKGIYVWYNPYDIGPYAMGSPGFELTFNELKPFTGKTAPIRRMVN
jgi:hypothetical protein